MFFLIVLVLLIGSVYASAEDLSSMTDEELYRRQDQIRAELERRKINQEKIISQADGITVCFTGCKVEESYENTYKLEIEITAVNNGDSRVYIAFETISINGWDVFVNGYVDLEPGKKVKKSLVCYEVDKETGIKSVDEIEEIEFYSYSMNPENYKTLTPNIRMIVKMK